MNKWLSIQALRGIAVLSVVAFHLISIEKKYSGGDLLLPDVLRLGQSGVDLFFVISGFVMAAITKPHFAQKGVVAHFVWARLSRIYPTYWLYFSLTLFVFLIKPEWVNASQGNQADLLSSFFLLPSAQLPLVMVAWSLIHELWFYFVFAVLLSARRRFLVPSLLMWAGIIVAANLLFSTMEMSPGLQIILHPYSIEFILGALVGIFASRERNSMMPPTFSLMLITAVATAGLPLVYALDILRDDGIVRAVITGSLYALLILALAALEKGGHLKPPRPFTFIGDISYSIYLSHILVLSAIGRLWATFSSSANNSYGNALAIFAMLMAVIGCGWISYRLVERPALRISRALRSRWSKSDTPPIVVLG